MAGRGRGHGCGCGDPERDQMFVSLNQTLQNSQNMQQMFMQYMQDQQHQAQVNQPDPFSKLSFHFGKSVTKWYDGTVDPEKIADYFRDIEKNFVKHNVPDHYKVRLAEHFLEISADDWWTLSKTDATASLDFNWDKFKALLEDQFFPLALKNQKMDEFTDLKQEKMSVQA